MANSDANGVIVIELVIRIHPIASFIVTEYTPATKFEKVTVLVLLTEYTLPFIE
ncbi:hypothetical protein D3C85_1879380 [compost metagenome]